MKMIKMKKFCICNKLFTEEDKKVKDHDKITVKYRGSAHQGCNTNLRLTEKVPVIFHNLRSYDGHLIMQEISNYDLEISVILNGLEKYMTSTIDKNLVFIDSMQFINSSIDAFVNNWSDSDSKHLSEEFSG